MNPGKSAASPPGVGARRIGATGLACLIVALPAQTLQSAGLTTDSPSHEAATTAAVRILVRPNPNANLSAVQRLFSGRVVGQFPAMGNLQILEMPDGASAAAAVAAYSHSGLVQYAERDQLVHALVEPNDQEFVSGSLWHLENLGQSGGVTSADIGATSAWNTLTDASSVIVAVLDSGVRATHEDLAANLWINPGEIPDNGQDDDNNGYVDDVIGINTRSKERNPDDNYGHGSHVAGIIGAVGNNGVGVAGVCWRAQLMICKFLDSHGYGPVSEAVRCIDYARSNGAKIINLSWGDPAYESQALYDALASARAAGVIVVCACGNSAADNDNTPLYPASYTLDNIIAVAATTRSDALASFSSYGARSVDLGAPGQDIVSCWVGADNVYTIESGTSMAAPMVAGACALLWARFPGENYRNIMDRILGNVDPLPSLDGRCVTGGRLNVARALAGEKFSIAKARWLSPGNVALTWASEPGKDYQVEFKNELTNGAWENLSGNITATSLFTSWTNAVGDAMQRYYIVRRTN